MPDTFPPGYYDAREKCSCRLLGHFDEQLALHAHRDLTPTNTPQGLLYFVTSVALAGIPQLLLWSSNLRNSSIRHALYNNLVHIAQDKRRLQLSDTSDCLHALNSTLAFQDLAQCPIDMLTILLLPDFQNFLHNDSIQIQLKKSQMDTEILEASNDFQKETLRKAQSGLQTTMEQLRLTGYSKAKMQLIINQVRGEKLNQSWQDLLASKIQVLKAHHQTMRQLSPEDKAIFSRVNDLIDLLSNANNDYIKEYNVARSPQDKLNAAQKLLKVCGDEVKATKQFLIERNPNHKLLSILDNVLNTLFAIITLGTYYLLPHRFRLFSLQSPNVSIGYSILDNAEEYIDRSKREIIELHERESQVTLS